MFHVKHLFPEEFCHTVLLGGAKVSLPIHAGLTGYLHLPTNDIP